jgi:hypothetical protein
MAMYKDNVSDWRELSMYKDNVSDWPELSMYKDNVSDWPMREQVTFNEMIMMSTLY